MTSRFASKARQALTCVALVAPMVSVWAQGEQLDDEDLAGVWGQAMFSVDNLSSGVPGATTDFTRITLNADVKLNANLTNIQLGKIGTDPAALDIADMRFVSSDNGAGGTNPYVKLTDPYIEFVYKNQGDAANREIVGMRLGFGAMDGNLRLKLNGLRGNFQFDQGASNSAANQLGTLTLNSATRATEFAPTAGAPISVGLVDEVKATGATDFFISMLAEATTFAKDGASAPEGVSMNWTRGVSYISAQGAILANPLPPLRTRQGG